MNEEELEFVEELKDTLHEQYNEIQELNKRIDKAVEYIENDLQISILPNNQIINGTEVVKRINKIINILKGDNND